MEMRVISPETRERVLAMQKTEITESHIYKNISARSRTMEDRRLLEQIAGEEQAHAARWELYTQRQVTPHRLKVFGYSFLSRIFGYTFILKIMEQGENRAMASYARLAVEIPEASAIYADEERHENELLQMLDERHLQYMGLMVLGLSDGLVELTGTLAGLALALQNNRLVALAGLITGISATLSMAASQYLAAQADQLADALPSAIYTGLAYLSAVVLLLFPFLIFSAHQVSAALGLMLLIVVLTIFVFNYYLAVVRDLPFKKRFLEMLVITLGVALLAFVIGMLAKKLLGINI
jgi:VIT1/CCC1 family predicted Fe2+/Mn2+ transporter